MNFKSLLFKSWDLLLRHFLTLVLLTLVLFGITAITMGILAPVCFAGYMQSLLTLIRTGREPKLQDLFSQMHLFLPLLGFAILIGLVAAVGFMIFVLPGVVVLVAITFFCIYSVPLMSDRHLGLMDAIRTSNRMIWQHHLGEHLVVVVIYLGIKMIGNALFVGSLFSEPLATLFLLMVYEEKVRYIAG